MKKIVISLLSLLVLITLGGCQSKFDPQTSLEESRTTLNEFLKSYSNKEKIIESYDKKTLNEFFEVTEKEYFSKNFKKNILPDKLNNLKYDSSKEWSDIGEEFTFLTVKSEEKGVLWVETKILEDTLDTEKETVTFFVSPDSISQPSNYIEMIKEDGKWKINNMLAL